MLGWIYLLFLPRHERVQANTDLAILENDAAVWRISFSAVSKTGQQPQDAVRQATPHCHGEAQSCLRWYRYDWSATSEPHRPLISWGPWGSWVPGPKPSTFSQFQLDELGSPCKGAYHAFVCFNLIQFVCLGPVHPPLRKGMYHGRSKCIRSIELCIGTVFFASLGSTGGRTRVTQYSFQLHLTWTPPTLSNINILHILKALEDAATTLNDATHNKCIQLHHTHMSHIIYVYIYISL
jgi:hypothetical protein